MNVVMPDILRFSLTVRFLADWHIGSGLERPGAEDRLVRRDDDELPYAPAKTLTGMIRDAAEQLALGLAQEQAPVVENRADNNADNAYEQSLQTSLWFQWVLWLFGDQPHRTGDSLVGRSRPHEGRISIRPAYLPDDLKTALGQRAVRSGTPPAGESHRQLLRESLFFTKPGVKLLRNGRAADKCLRFEEMVRAPMTLRGYPKS